MWLAMMKSLGLSPGMAAVLAHHEYEAWFLGALASLRGHRGVRGNATPPPDPEAVSGAKEYLQSQLDSGRYYSETVDQPAFSALFDLALARSACPSFDKLWREFATLLGKLAPNP
jgi:hypothetical protein